MDNDATEKLVTKNDSNLIAKFLDTLNDSQTFLNCFKQ